MWKFFCLVINISKGFYVIVLGGYFSVVDGLVGSNFIFGVGFKI